jgi:hypothetical protein
VTKDDGSKELVKTRNILIATGSEVTLFPGIEVHVYVCLPISKLYKLDLHCINDLVSYTAVHVYLMHIDGSYNMSNIPPMRLIPPSLSVVYIENMKKYWTNTLSLFSMYIHLML